LYQVDEGDAGETDLQFISEDESSMLEHCGNVGEHQATQNEPHGEGKRRCPECGTAIDFGGKWRTDKLFTVEIPFMATYTQETCTSGMVILGSVGGYSGSTCFAGVCLAGSEAEFVAWATRCGVREAG
jgi:hypothetical protein